MHEATYKFKYTCNEKEADQWLADIQAGRIGLDTEACPRTVSPEEASIILTGTRADRLQYLRDRFASHHEIDWNAIGICTVQVAFASRVLIMNIKRMKGDQRLASIKN
jgi:hypothetical protein